MYSEKDITWSFIEKYVSYHKTVWSVCDNGIPTFAFMDENNNKIVKDNEC